MGLDVRLRLARLYMCTDLRERQGDFIEFVSACLNGGVDVIQIRQPGLTERQELAALEKLRELSFPFEGLVVVNDSPTVARAFQADVLHLRPGGIAPKQARPSLHQWGLIGQGARTPKQIDAALADPDVDYLTVGPVYPTPDFPDASGGTDLVRYAATVAPPGDIESRPWFAGGGVSEDNLEEVLAAGARRIAVIRALAESTDPQATAERLANRLRRAWNEDPAMQDYLAKAFRGPQRKRGGRR